VRNLLHYLALCKHDLRDLQSRLTALGPSSLERLPDASLEASSGRPPSAPIFR
jgi:hypothetical protein